MTSCPSKHLKLKRCINGCHQFFLFCFCTFSTLFGGYQGKIPSKPATGAVGLRPCLIIQMPLPLLALLALTHGPWQVHASASFSTTLDIVGIKKSFNYYSCIWSSKYCSPAGKSANILLLPWYFLPPPACPPLPPDPRPQDQAVQTQRWSSNLCGKSVGPRTPPKKYTGHAEVALATRAVATAYSKHSAPHSKYCSSWWRESGRTTIPASPRPAAASAA